MRKQLLIILGILLLITSTASAATLTVESKHYKTIQSAITASHNGDTIKVPPGTYKENLKIVRKDITITGTSFPTIYSAEYYDGAGGLLYGFKICSNGIDIHDGAYVTVRNNAFTKKGVDITGQTASAIVMNNKFTGCGISIYESFDNSIIGNYISGAPIGFVMRGSSSCKTITKNTFTGCGIGVEMEYIPSYLIGNHYSKNKVNIKVVEPV